MFLFFLNSNILLPRDSVECLCVYSITNDDYFINIYTCILISVSPTPTITVTLDGLRSLTASGARQRETNYNLPTGNHCSTFFFFTLMALYVVLIKCLDGEARYATK